MAVIEIDPYEALILLARADGELLTQVGERIDIWHHYGQDTGDWELDDKSIIFIPSGGELDHDNSIAHPVFEVRCYARTPYECGQVWRSLVGFTNVSTENNNRRNAIVTEGTALIYFVLPVEGAGMPRLLFDEDIKPNGGLPYYSGQFKAQISTVTVT